MRSKGHNVNIKDTPVAGRFQGVRGSLPGARDKDQTNSLLDSNHSGVFSSCALGLKCVFTVRLLTCPTADPCLLLGLCGAVSGARSCRRSSLRLSALRFTESACGPLRGTFVPPSCGTCRASIWVWSFGVKFCDLFLQH